MGVRKTLPILILTGALAFGGAACGDKTVTSSPPATQAPANDANGSASNSSNDSSVAATSAADADLTQVDQLLRDIDGDVSAADQDAATPEGDPSQ
jgi:hypothetical protein